MAKSLRRGPLSPYMQRQRAMGTYQERLLLPKRPRNVGDVSVLKDFHHDFQRENGGKRAAEPPKGAERFYRLPPEQRPAAEAYYAKLCFKWARRIKATPGFARVLHMITLNQFKNPGQPLRALKHSNKVQGHSIGLRRKLERAIFTDTPENTPLPSTRISRLSTF